MVIDRSTRQRSLENSASRHVKQSGRELSIFLAIHGCSTFLTIYFGFDLGISSPIFQNLEIKFLEIVATLALFYLFLGREGNPHEIILL